ncbi:alpha/beta fold hydrolase [Dyella flava]|uniref:Alpha/beta fold hydrolase n=1 Tax=Dyella flava TaxID=1920170 RepID=A0ABS2JY07_9GAMM|nr:alpha/beta hydrolase [Dyella flava]MBM7123870.1 alpha/beta fold hydrolase [Dyella flava]GLQ52606.1 alpha/beta hydrolase [Dyella flava]
MHRVHLLRDGYLALVGVLALFAVTCVAAAGNSIKREDFRVMTWDGVHIHVREVTGPAVTNAEPLILIHGARVPGIASFDLPVPHGSLAADLALRTGRPVYVMDARGYGGSDRPAAMDQPPSASLPLSRAYEVVRDIDAVASEAMRRSGAKQVALFGWATGGMWAAYYASLYPQQVSHLIMLNALYGGSSKLAAHAVLGRGTATSDPAHPDRLAPGTGGYALYTVASLFPAWDRTIPVADKNAWRDPALAAAYAKAALDSDPAAYTHRPPSFRAPLGAIEDSFYQSEGRQLFDASSITGRVLIVHAQLDDFWSRPEDGLAFQHDAVHARSVHLLDLPNATHFVHLDRPQHGREQLLDAVSAFLADKDP